jgi:hypothetical protein
LPQGRVLLLKAIPAMHPLPVHRRATGLALVAVAGVTTLLLLGGCDRRPTDPPRPSDPQGTTPRPSTSLPQASPSAAPSASAASQ